MYVSPYPTYLMDGIFRNQKPNNNIRISYSLKYKHPKKEYILYEKINGSVKWNEGVQY